MPAGITPMPAVLMNSLSAAPRSTTLVSPVTIVTPARSAMRRMLSGDATQRFHRQAFLQHHAAGQEQRTRAADREVVHRAGNRERADIRAGEEQRIHHVAVGGEGQPIAMAGKVSERQACVILG